jgi:hypothetical protein
MKALNKLWLKINVKKRAMAIIIFVRNAGRARSKEVLSEWRVSETFIGKITLEDAKFIYDHAEKQLKEVNATSNIIVTRSSSLASVAAAALIALISYSINRWDTKSCWDGILITSLFASVCLFYQCIILTLNLRGVDYKEIGAEPASLLLESFYASSTDDERIIFFYINEIESYQTKMTLNKLINEKRWKRFHRSLWTLVFTPVFIALVYILIDRFLYLPC